MVASLELHRHGAPVPAFLGASGGADYDRWSLCPGAVLGPSELVLFEQLKFPLRRTSYFLGRLALKRALGALLKEPRTERLEILAGVFGQPLLSHPGPAQAEISLAHSQGLAVGAASTPGHPIGIDLEFIDPERQDLFPKMFPREELALLSALGIAPPVSGFLLWAVREALSKVLRCGLTVPFEILRPRVFLPESSDPACGYRAEFENFLQYQARAWIVGGYVLAVVLPKNTSLSFLPPRAFAELCEVAAKMAPGLAANAAPKE